MPSMIDDAGNLRCPRCHTILARNLHGRVEIMCYRSHCRRDFPAIYVFDVQPIDNRGGSSMMGAIPAMTTSGTDRSVVGYYVEP